MEATPKPVPNQPLFTTTPMSGPVGAVEVPPILPIDDVGPEDGGGGGPMLEHSLENGGPAPSTVRQESFSGRCSLLIQFFYSLKCISRQTSLLD